MLARCLQEQPDLGLAEAVDRLHGITHHEQGTTVLGSPLAGKTTHELALQHIGVLELVDQQVLDATVEVLEQPARLFDTAQCGNGAYGYFRKIYLPLLAEHLPQFGVGHEQYLEKSLERRPALGRKPGRRRKALVGYGRQPT